MTRSDDRFRSILDASPIPLIISRVSDGIILHVNEHLAALVGLTPEEAIGRETVDFYHDLEERTLVLDRLQKDGYIRDHELRIKRGDGQVVWVMLSLVATELDGEPVVVGGLYDTTERVQMEESLRESEALFRQLTENINEVFWIRDVKTAQVLYVSPGYERIFGCRCADFCERAESLLDNVHPDDRERLRRLQAASLDQSFTESREEEYRIVQPDGTIRWIRTRAFPIRNSAGETDRVCGVSEDFTEHRQAEEALRESEERFRNIVEYANDILYSLTTDGVFTYVSPNWTDILGHDVSEVNGQSFAPFVHPEDLPACLAFLNKVIETGEKQSGIEYRVKHKDGSWRWHTSNASCLKDDHGNQVSFIGIARDVTDKKRASEELRRANRELRETQAQLVQSEKMASLGNLVAGIAHEINTPVGAIHSMHDTLIRAVEKLQRTLASDLPQEYWEDQAIQSTLKVISDANRVIAAGSERVTEIVHSLRSFARLDEAEMKEADLHEGIDNALTLVDHALKGRIDVVKHYSNIPPIVCYPSRLNQVFLNILVNAAQAIEDTGEITIATFVKGDRAHVTIRDTGVGIPEDHLKEIYDPGFTTKGVGVGTGLGLSICYQIIQDHEGEIQVESQIGEGTTFTVVLPTDLDENAGPPSGSPS